MRQTLRRGCNMWACGQMGFWMERGVNVDEDNIRRFLTLFRVTANWCWWWHKTVVSGGVLSLLDGEGSYVGTLDRLAEFPKHQNQVWTGISMNCNGRFAKDWIFLVFFGRRKTKQLFRPGTLLLTLCTMVCNEILAILPTPNIIN